MEPENKEVKGNSAKDLMAFLSSPEKPIKVAEFSLFWKSLSEKEKEYYRSAPLA